MRHASLKPYKSETSPNRPWCVDVPPHLSDTGKRKRKFFKTEREAKTECETLKTRRDNFGVSLPEMTPARIAEAAEAYKRLEGHPISLLDAVGMALAPPQGSQQQRSIRGVVRSLPRSHSKTFGQAQGFNEADQGTLPDAL